MKSAPELPQQVLVDPQGKVRCFVEGAVDDGDYAEIAALVAYSNARVALDQTLGTTLEENHVSIQEAVSGRVARPSALPASLPSQPGSATAP